MKRNYWCLSNFKVYVSYWLQLRCELRASYVECQKLCYSKDVKPLCMLYTSNYSYNITHIWITNPSEGMINLILLLAAGTQWSFWKYIMYLPMIYSNASFCNGHVNLVRISGLSALNSNYLRSLLSDTQLKLHQS